MNRQRDAHLDLPSILPAASGSRLSRQIERAFRGTFGARTGLRTLMQSIAAEMLAAGVSRQRVAATLETCVLHHPARGECDSRSLITGQSNSASLVELANECVAAVAHPDDEAAGRPVRRAD